MRQKIDLLENRNNKLKNKLKFKYNDNSMEPFSIPENMDDSTVRELFIKINKRLTKMEKDINLLKEMNCLPMERLKVNKS